jgi:peroxiredoxin
VSVEVGQKAPKFEMHSDSMEVVKLSSLRGNKLLLLFVQLAFTST